MVVTEQGVSIVTGINRMLPGAGIGALDSSRSSTKQLPSANNVSFRLTTDPSDFVSLDIVIDLTAFGCISPVSN